MFYSEGSYCYCSPDSQENDVVTVGGKEYGVEFDHMGEAYVTGDNGQTYILSSLTLT